MINWYQVQENFFKTLNFLKGVLIIFIVLAVLLISGSLVVIYHYSHSFREKIENPNNREVVMFASILPVSCSFFEFANHDAEIEEYFDFLDEAMQGKKRCSTSLRSALVCYQELKEKLDEPVEYLELYEKSKRLYSAHEAIKKLISDTHERVSQIEPYDENSKKLKEELLSFISLIQRNNDIFKLFGNKGEGFLKEVEKRAVKIWEGENFQAVNNDLARKYPEVAFVLSLPEDLGKIVLFTALFMNSDFIEKGEWEKVFNRSEVFKQNRLNGCLTDENLEFLFSSGDDNT